MATLYCDCGQEVWATYRWNGLAEVRELWNENGEPIENCPRCGQAIAGFPLKSTWLGDIGFSKSDTAEIERTCEELSYLENSINAMDRFCKWVETKAPAFAADIRDLFTEYITRPTLHSGDVAPMGESEKSSSILAQRA